MRETTNPLRSLWDWPGKGRPAGGGAGRHPALCHMLDVGAVANVLLEAQGRNETEVQAMTLLVCLHDIGKLSDSFRRQIAENRPSRFPHWQLSDHHLLKMRGRLAERLGLDPEHLRCLIPVISGHHGRPPDRNQFDRDPKERGIGAAAREAADAALDILFELFPEARLVFADQEAAQAEAWRFGGLVVAADWIGSNQRWFPYAAPPESLSEYWGIARDQARCAVDEAGVSPAGIARAVASTSLCSLSSLRPMQQAAEAVALPDGPVLAVIEDTTGAGKTEAAMILAQRMLAHGKAHGLYFALPTTATADQIWTRLGPVVTRMFARPPSLALAHGRSALHRGYRDGLRAGTDRPEEEDSPGCAAWIADDRRRAFLAEVGVGTIDQALLGVLPVRFGLLRLYGLSQRLLIVDEAHAYDPYMQAELQRLLEFHASLGGSAIVMTATLPETLRKAYVGAFLDGLGHAAPNSDSSAAYPSLSMVAAECAATQPVEAARATCRVVAVERLDDAGDARTRLTKAAATGAACCWVRNSVDEAIAAFDALRAAGTDATLLHARFAMTDRQRLEAEVIASFGREAQPGTRAGRVLVATQVVESSLDLDFDVMVSDLAPIDSLIQRAGRLWRHMDRRPTAGRSVARPVLHVLSPDPARVRDDRWLHEVMDGGAFVYPHSTQWRTALALFEAGRIASPDGLRPLIEAVYGPDAPEVPSSLARAEADELGRASADRTHAHHNLLDPRDGYMQCARVGDDATYPTRLGPEQVTLALARSAGDNLVPYADDPDPVRAWALSELILSRRKWQNEGGVDQEQTAIAAVKSDWPDWRRAAVTVVPLDALSTTGLDYAPDRGLFVRPPQ